MYGVRKTYLIRAKSMPDYEELIGLHTNSKKNADKMTDASALMTAGEHGSL